MTLTLHPTVEPSARQITPLHQPGERVVVRLVGTFMRPVPLSTGRLAYVEFVDARGFKQTITVPAYAISGEDCG